jgi:hypothetical protein
MVDFYATRDATEMMAFVLDCHPEASQIRQLNPGLLAVRDLPDIKYHSLRESAEQTNQVDSSHAKERAGADKTQPERDSDADFDPEP